MAKFIIALAAVSYCAVGVNGFTAANGITSKSLGKFENTVLRAQGMDEVQTILQESYPEFDSLIKGNEELWKKLSDSDSFTIFAPSSAAYKALGEDRKKQLKDPRNGELAEKIGMYHAIGEEVTAEALFNAGGVITMGGEVSIERNRSGGMFGVGGTEDGVKVGNSKVVQSINVGSGVIHEVDGFIHPFLLWRYADQLRIPGSQ
eukprot:CAMPEP_0198249674 /NCGR_PEP_ID=MMETSP1447-20131203/1118_1 /TAXON_ID=420782 /ORGANISM="Chaetoceros dichaeta, Strain CCMP1751" /LENGTH=203 /DNA_ID=CAMNT_0043934359 /DNA_START=37 /DNA_END=648 /DNA_ORIENTATION=-